MSRKLNKEISRRKDAAIKPKKKSIKVRRGHQLDMVDIGNLGKGGNSRVLRQNRLPKGMRAEEIKHPEKTTLF